MLRDVIVSAFADSNCSTSYPHQTSKDGSCRTHACQDAACTSWTGSRVETPSLLTELWEPDRRPASYSVAPVNVAPKTPPASGNFAQAVIEYTNQRGSFLAPFVLDHAKSDRARFPKGTVPGRICAIGFSAGCGMVRQLLAGPDAAKLDSAFLFDGMAGNWAGNASPPPNRNTPEAAAMVLEAGLTSVAKFALRAAMGGPALVVTCTKIIPNSPLVCSTFEAMLKLESMLQAQGVVPEPASTPFILTGNPPPLPPLYDAKGGFWPGQHNSPSRFVKVREWGAVHNFIKGNLALVAFDPRMELANNQPDPTPSSSSGAAHIFQAEWVQEWTWRTVLEPRWKKECGIAVGPPLPGTGFAGEYCAPPGIQSDLFTEEELEAARKEEELKQMLAFSGAALGGFLVTAWLATKKW